MAKIITVSNRLPITLSLSAGAINITQSSGGLATGLSSLPDQQENIWIGFPGIFPKDINEEVQVKHALIPRKLIPVFLSQPDYISFYEGFSNSTLWPLFHYLQQYSKFDNHEWEIYKKVNQIYAEEILKNYEKGDLIWIHDYQLLLLPNILREHLSDAKIGFFQHIPFPAYQIFRLLPWRLEILRGLMGADLIGFHTHEDVKNFLDSVSRILRLDNKMGEVRMEERMVYVDAFPLGIDFEKFQRLSRSRSTEKLIKKYFNNHSKVKIILSIDRLDYTKGIPERLEAFEMFLEKYPEYTGKVSLVMVVVPSREKVSSYVRLKKKIDELVGHINSKYRTMDWVPVIYLFRSLPIEVLSAFYTVSDIALVTPLRDGMNLVSKEYIASRQDQDGVLILSEMAGASKELNEAIIINPYNIIETAEAIKDALCLPLVEQKRRMKYMQGLLKKYDVFHWFSVYIKTLNDTKKKQSDLATKFFGRTKRLQMLEEFSKAESKILFLDYDGTLVPFQDEPELAKPDAELMQIVKNLSRMDSTQVVIVSGRDKNSLEQWFGKMNVSIIAEHGIWIKNGDVWSPRTTGNSLWKEQIRPVLNFFVDRTPGSFIEEKDFSLVWHYRKSDPDLAETRSRELINYLHFITANMGLSILEGKKVIEIKNAFLNKATAVREFMQDKFDFIMAAGDDWTDEDMFRVLPSYAYSIKVGFTPSYARFNIKSCDNMACEEIRKILKFMIETTIKVKQ